MTGAFDMGTCTSPSTYSQIREGHLQVKHGYPGLLPQQMFPLDMTEGTAGDAIALLTTHNNMEMFNTTPESYSRVS